jgi:diketogulonate reductase-like aldo/keto reductase
VNKEKKKNHSPILQLNTFRLVLPITPSLIDSSIINLTFNMAKNDIKIVFGGGAFIAGDAYEGNDKLSKFLDVIEELKIGTIDTAAGYGDSERLLGQNNAASRFTIDTKFSAGFTETPSSKDDIIKTGKESLEKLDTKTVSRPHNTHSPCAMTNPIIVG